jgi:hypothetical protein
MHASRGHHHDRLSRVGIASLLCVWLICSGGGSPAGHRSCKQGEHGISFVDAGADRTVTLGSRVQLEGTSASIATHKWQFSSRPDGSFSQIQNADSLTGASFVADALGAYSVELLGAFSSAPGATDVQVDKRDTVVITAVTPGEDGGTGGTGATADCPDPGDLVTVADAYVRGGLDTFTAHGTEPLLLVKGDPSLNFARKTYMVFELAALPPVYSSVELVLTLGGLGTATPVDLYGAAGNSGWNPMSSPSESEITWSNAPLNDVASHNLFLGDMGGVREPISARYDFGMPSVPLDVPEGTQYGIDVTAFVRSNEGQLITLMLAHSDMDSIGGPAFKSKETLVDEPCGAPFLHFEP